MKKQVFSPFLAIRNTISCREGLREICLSKTDGLLLHSLNRSPLANETLGACPHLRGPPLTAPAFLPQLPPLWRGVESGIGWEAWLSVACLRSSIALKSAAWVFQPFYPGKEKWPNLKGQWRVAVTIRRFPSACHSSRKTECLANAWPCYSLLLAGKMLLSMRSAI